jgi:WD40 repeat protein
MTTGGSDRELLFGLLAFQNSFIDRETLLGAFQSWMADKSRSLATILRESDKLPAEQADLLEALVKVHLQQHANDAQQSLAAVSSLGSVREDLEQLGDPELQASLGAVSITRQASPDDIATLIGPDTGSPATATCSSPSASSRFRVLRPHARGGLGTVYVAVDGELNREVALKEIQTQHADNLDNRERFVREALVTGGLEHPNIVPVYGLGTYADGRPYYAMRFVKGDSLQEAIEAYHRHRQEKQPDPVALNLELRKLLGRFIDICNAMEYAHSRGVLHRDLKPGNIMLGKYGETLVVDWGLAKPLGHREKTPDSAEATLVPSGSGSSETLPGSTIGTPAYMSPEQAAGKLEELGPSSDVYSLGATLYHLLTGKAPFQGEARYVLGQVMEGAFKKPRAVAAHVPAALEAICLKGMALEPQNRYQSPRQLADDVEHWLGDEPVSAYREPLKVRVGRWSRKHRTWVMSAGALLVTAVVSLAVGNVLLKQANVQTAKARDEATSALKEADQQRQAALEAERKANDERDRAEEERKRAELAAEKEAEATRVAQAAAEKAKIAADEAIRSSEAEKHAREAEKVARQEAVAAAQRAMEEKKRADQNAQVAKENETAAQLAANKEAESAKLAENEANLAKQERDRAEAARNQAEEERKNAVAATEKLERQLYVNQITSAQREWENSNLADAWIYLNDCPQKYRGWEHDYLYTLFTDGQTTLRGHEERVSSVGFSPDGRRVVSGSFDNTIKIWDAATGREALTLKGHTLAVCSVCFSDGDQKIISTSFDKTIKVWDATTGLETASIDIPGCKVDPFIGFLLSPKGNQIAGLSDNGSVKIWNTINGQETLTLKGPIVRIGGIAFSPDGKQIAILVPDNAQGPFVLKIWNTTTGQETLTLKGNPRPVSSMAYSPDGKRIVTGNVDSTLKVWDASTGQEILTLKGHAGGIGRVAYSPDGKRIVSGSMDGIKIWNAIGGNELATLKGHISGIADVAFSPDGNRIVSCSGDKTIKLWELNSSRDFLRLGTTDWPSTDVSFNPKGMRLASGRRDGTIAIWDEDLGNQLLTIKAHTEQVDDVAFSPDGNRISSCSEDNTIKVWDAISGRLALNLKVEGLAEVILKDTNSIQAIATPGEIRFSPDGKFIVGSGDSIITIWDAIKGDLHFAFQGGSVDGIGFSPDGTRIVCCHENYPVIRVWSLLEKSMAIELKGHLEPVSCVAFSPDGLRIASGKYRWCDLNLGCAEWQRCVYS